MQSTGKRENLVKKCCKIIKEHMTDFKIISNIKFNKNATNNAKLMWNFYMK